MVVKAVNFHLNDLGSILFETDASCCTIGDFLCAALTESSAGGSEPQTTLRLGDIALALQGDWLMMATQLGITSPEVIKIQKEYGSVTEQVGNV